MAKKISLSGNILTKNFGRFLSIKVFGYNHARRGKIFLAISTASSGASDSQRYSDDTTNRIDSKLLNDDKPISNLDIIEEIRFGGNVAEISEALDQLLIIYKSNTDKNVKSAARAKAITGIIILESIGDYQLAKHYKKQITHFAYADLGFIVALIVMLIVMFLAFN